MREANLRRKLRELLDIAGLNPKRFLHENGNLNWRELVDYLILVRIIRPNFELYGPIFKIGKRLVGRLSNEFYDALNAKREYDRTEPTPLIWAVKKNYFTLTGSKPRNDLVKLLLEWGADPNLTDNLGKTALYWAIQLKGKMPIALYLMEFTDLTLKYNFALRERYQFVPLHFISREINHADGTILYVAVIFSNPLIIKALIDKGADKNAKDNLGDTPLHISIRQKSNISFRALLSENVKLNEKNNDGNTPLHLSMSGGSMKKFRPLLAAGANPNLKNDQGFTPLHLAVQSTQPLYVSELIEAGAVKTKTDNEGRTPLDILNANPPSFFRQGIWQEAKGLLE